MIFFHINSFSIDATEDNGSLGRLVNDSKLFANSKAEKLGNKSYHIGLFATRDIFENEEIIYFYGEEGLPWHGEVSIHIFKCIVENQKKLHAINKKPKG